MRGEQQKEGTVKKKKAKGITEQSDTLILANTLNKLSDRLEKSMCEWKKAAQEGDSAELEALINMAQPLTAMVNRIEGFINGNSYTHMVSTAASSFQVHTVTPPSNAASEHDQTNTLPLKCILCNRRNHLPEDCRWYNNYIVRRAAAKDRNICMRCVTPIGLQLQKNHVNTCVAKNIKCAICTSDKKPKTRHHLTFCPSPLIRKIQTERTFLHIIKAEKERNNRRASAIHQIQPVQKISCQL